MPAETATLSPLAHAIASSATTALPSVLAIAANPLHRAGDKVTLKKRQMQPLPDDAPNLKMENISSLYSKRQKKSPNGSSKESKDIDNVSPSFSCKNGAAAQDSLLPKCSSKSLVSVGAFTVQCSRCLQWRYIPTQEKYEEIRESILQEPFYCENAKEWQPNASCSDPANISPERGGFWAIDKPNIPRSPQGWQRILKVRGEGGTRFADVYYVSPTGKRLRSKTEIERYLIENPKYEQLGINSSKFSFQTPRPLQENYVRKKTPSSGSAHGSLEVALIVHDEGRRGAMTNS